MTAEPTEIITRAKRTDLTDRQRNELQIRCLGYLAESMGLNDIVEREGISIWHVRQAIDGISKEARNSLLSSFIAERIPLQMEVSLETLRICQRKLFDIMNSPSSDARLQAQCCSQIGSIVKQSNDILESSSLIAKAVRHVLVLHPPAKEGQQEEGPKPEEGGQSVDPSTDSTSEEETI